MSPSLHGTLTQHEADRLLACTHQAVTFHGYVLKDLDFSGRDLRGVFFAGIWIERCSFRGAELAGTSFYSSILNSVDFSDAALGGTIFYRAKLSDCRLDGMRAPFWKKAVLHAKNV